MEFDTTNWGYNPKPVYEAAEKNSPTNHYSLRNFVIAKDAITNEAVPNTNAVSVPEILRELQFMPLQGDSFLLFKRYIIVINFRNMGATTAICCSVMVSDFTLDSLNGKGRHKLRGDQLTLGYNENIASNFIVDQKLNDDIADTFSFNFGVSYRDVNNEDNEKWVKVQYMFNQFIISDLTF